MTEKHEHHEPQKAEDPVSVLDMLKIFASVIGFGIALGLAVGLYHQIVRLFGVK